MEDNGYFERARVVVRGNLLSQEPYRYRALYGAAVASIDLVRPVFTDKYRPTFNNNNMGDNTTKRYIKSIMQVHQSIICRYCPLSTYHLGKESWADLQQQQQAAPRRRHP